ncbi:MAG: GAF domain-containing protein [Actinomycetota bacterium]
MSDHAGPRSLRQLLDAVVMIGSDLDLHAMLRRIIESAVALVEARYGALGVLNEAKTGLIDFITVGIDDEGRRAIATLPKGLGILGLLITDAKPLRLADLREHPDSAGFPPNHPPMRSFLGVPIRLRGEVFGNLYLTDKTTAEVFTDIDEELAVGLAAAAGVAIENARLYEHGRRREAALAAMNEIATALITGTDAHESLQLIARRARELVDGDVATIALPDAAGSMMRTEVVDGAPESYLGESFRRNGSIAGDVLLSGATAIVEDASQDPRVQQPMVRGGDTGPAIFVALLSEGEPFGTLAVARAKGAAMFAPGDVDLVQSFAAQASVVLENERARRHAHRLSLLEDQERIARDLHDTVIQRLFATGLSLQGATRIVRDADARQRIDAAVEDLDVTVRHIRTVIFDVGRASANVTSGLRSRVLEVAREVGRPLGFEPRVTFDGAIDAAVPTGVGEELLASLREALSNVARHARASRADVEVSVDGDVVLSVRDDGVGISDEAAEKGGSGLANLRSRATRLGGGLSIARGEGGGTVLEWRVPVTPS